MRITRFSPIGPLDMPTLPRRFTDVLDDFFSDAVKSSNEESFKPGVDISEDEKAYHLEVVLPGMSKEDISINLDNNRLTISGERKFDTEKKNKQYHLVESGYGKFTRSFILNDDVREDTIDARFENGILKIDLEKKEEKIAKQIEIK